MDLFSAALRQASIQDHSAAEQTSYIGDLMAGKLPVAAYAALSAQLHAVYTVLEEAADALREHPVAGRFVFEELRRTPSLEADLTLLAGANWAERIAVSPATDAYVARLRAVAFDWPGGFVAHHYVRYLGDLSGGQIIGRGVERAYDLVDGAGAQFYRFPLIPKPKNFKDAYRTLLDEAPFDAADREKIIAEVKLAYRLNTDVLVDLGASVRGAA
ncbi:biliverdin-producing heme oxygenase [Actinocorallia lasiicapitis]